MEATWFWLVALMLTGYVVLDGYDIGAGIIHLLAARSDLERRQILQSIGPFWDVNEVWLIAGGGTLYFAFPGLYASSFSGFYLPLMMVLWLLMLRGISIEVRDHIDSPVWKPFWDLIFASASALLAIFFGAALGNVVRGAPLDAEGNFFLPLWTNFQPSGEVGILDWYTVLVAVTAFCALLLHGALWVRLKTDGPLQARSRDLAGKAWWAMGLLTAIVTIVSFRVQPHLWQSFTERPWGYVFPAAAVASFLSIRLSRTESRAFLCSALFLLGMLTSVAFGLFPYVLPSNTDPNLSLTIYNTAPAEYGLRVGLAWWIPGMALASAYTIFQHRKFAGKVRPSEDVIKY
jgi:cytochrome d ubiquinol oxidase subunit II